MKQCPSCKTTYTDETLRFCLADGTQLVGLGGEQIRVEIPRETEQAPQSFQPAAATASGSSGGIFKVVLAVAGLGIFAVLAVAVSAFVYFNMNGPDKTTDAVNKDVKTLVTPTPAKDDKDELRDQIANLEKLLKDQKKTNQPANVPLTLPNQPASTTTARVNSPGDGFLALRTMPNSEIGERILKIPHGATVTVGGCLPAKNASRPGRWCRAGYNGYSGWVFDAYLLY